VSLSGRRRAAVAIFGAISLNALCLGLQAAQTGAVARPTPLEQALTRWQQGDQAGAIEQFIHIDWKAGPALSAHSPLKTREKDFPAMSAPAREELMAEVLPLLRDLRQLAAAVKEKALAVAGTNNPVAKSYLAKLAECGGAIDGQESLQIVRLTAQALQKMGAVGEPGAQSSGRTGVPHAKT